MQRETYLLRALQKFEATTIFLIFFVYGPFAVCKVNDF